jgi:hypothetical protein
MGPLGPGSELSVEDSGSEGCAGRHVGFVTNLKRDSICYTKLLLIPPISFLRSLALRFRVSLGCFVLPLVCLVQHFLLPLGGLARLPRVFLGTDALSGSRHRSCNT